MSRMWLKNGRAVLTDGRAVLCDECPCDQGCSYTYYVDHSVATSGDGHSWETAFKSINDVFNSGEIHGYRLINCAIYVKIRGIVDYEINGRYLLYSSECGIVYLESENEARIECNLATLILHGSSSYTAYAYIQFVNWDFVTIYNQFASYIAHIYFDHCNFTFNLYEKDYNGASYFIRCSNIKVNDSTIIVITSADEVTSYPSYHSGGDITIFETFDTSEAINTTVNFIGTWYGDPSGAVSGSADFYVFGGSYASSPTRNSLLESVHINFGPTIKYFQLARMTGFICGSYGNGSVLNDVSCSTEGLSVDNGAWYPGNYGSYVCCFSGYSNKISANTFYNCIQFCYGVGTWYDDFCTKEDGYCLALS